ncbi:MAG: hypothetical protein JXP34_08160 [Planctomycetes bacterium]|nr:hypothetical protein [Planctomycetota bacterium]
MTSRRIFYLVTTDGDLPRMLRISEGLRAEDLEIHIVESLGALTPEPGAVVVVDVRRHPNDQIRRLREWMACAARARVLALIRHSTTEQRAALLEVGIHAVVPWESDRIDRLLARLIWGFSSDPP